MTAAIYLGAAALLLAFQNETAAFAVGCFFLGAGAAEVFNYLTKG